MSKTYKLGLPILMVISLSACVSYEPNSGMRFYNHAWDGSPLYSEYHEGNYNAQDYSTRRTRQVVVPETYHVGSYHSPARASDRDNSWVNRQNPGNYTIELTRGQKASEVAKKLHNAPKTNRRAQVKTHQNGTTQYKGVYGSYPSYQAAKQALDALPSDMRKEANIKSWGSIQGTSQ